MFLSSKQEMIVLLGTIIGGGAIGITVDLFRIIRRSFKAASNLVWLQDIAMWCAVLAEVCTTLYIVSSGEVRWYVFLGFGAGFALYVLSLSRYIIAAATALLLWIKNAVCFTLALVATPVRLVKRFFLWIYTKIRAFSKKFHISFKKN